MDLYQSHDNQISTTFWGKQYPTCKSVLCVITQLIIWEDILRRITQQRRALRTCLQWLFDTGFFSTIPPRDILKPQSNKTNNFFIAEMKVIYHRVNITMCLLCVKHCANCCKCELNGYNFCFVDLYMRI